ncbi:MAG: 4-hydroxy-3-methylbut-2-enyl diphosphate reductase [Acidobacteriota bacterium]|nr:4-hydroxy-3-methylbut-2-enyl diphosphate reductase [Blastocatellia bacterium]MDW8239139.1 4-hydroxy-3-methylbut-2-enyl diphosphate reductase [Acidobacteriota bacterium]
MIQAVAQPAATNLASRVDRWYTSALVMSVHEQLASTIVRRGFGLKEEIKWPMAADYHSALVDRMKAEGYQLTVGPLSFRLAQEFGFCYGVDFALDLAYETRYKFPDRRIFLISEIIHNPRVNTRLQELGIRFLKTSDGPMMDLDEVTPEDVIIVPAFGATVAEMERLRQKGCVVVDTTCGSVIAVWKRVERYARDGFTAIIHGKYNHEETRATASQAMRFPGGRYLIVLDKQEAATVCHYIVHGGDKAAFLSQFAQAVSPDFDPDRDLQYVGLANQTTMLSSESLEIAEMFRQAIMQRYGPEQVGERFRSFDTICSATQNRQDAVQKLVQQNVDLMIVIGGYNSSNTNHLCEIASQYVPTYHINEVDCIVSDRHIRHQPALCHEEVISEGWLPDGSVIIGITAGASTPNRVIGEVIERIVACRGLSLAPDE